MHPFLQVHTPILKTVMRPRLPGCTFTPEDLADVAAATGLSAAQIRKWGENLRARYKGIEERTKYLNTANDNDDVDAGQEESRVQRYRWSAFNIGKEQMENFKLLKARNAGEYVIRFLTAAIDPRSYSVDVFIEFEEPVRQSKLRQQLKQYGAGSVQIDPCSANDQDAYAAAALAGVWLAARVKDDAGGSSASGAPSLYTFGTCTPSLLARAKSEMELHDRTEQAFDAKTHEALKQSIELSRATRTDIAAVAEDVRSSKTILTTLSWSQQELERLSKALKDKTLDCDRVEYSKGAITKKLNQALTASAIHEKNAKIWCKRAEERRAIIAKQELEIAEGKKMISELLMTITTLRESVNTHNTWFQQQGEASKKRRANPPQTNDGGVAQEEEEEEEEAQEVKDDHDVVEEENVEEDE